MLIEDVHVWCRVLLRYCELLATGDFNVVPLGSRVMHM